MCVLTVIVPVYNNSVTLARCLTSVRSSRGVLFDLIVIDDGSTDGSGDLARTYADEIIRFDKNRGREHARNAGLAAAKGKMVVFIDSDILIKEDTLEKIQTFLKTHPDVAAVTGRLSDTGTGKGFFSEYKNLYMHYSFGRLQKDVSFLYGAIFALNADLKNLFRFDRHTAEDTALGLALSQKGKRIAFLKDLEVVHMKEYTALTFLINDFKIPFHWAKLFWMSGGWRHILRNGPAFAHASKKQVLGLLLVLFTVISINTPWCPWIFLVWIGLNARFMYYLFRKRGLIFGIKGAAVTWMDHLVMVTGVITGTIFLLRWK